MGRKEEIVEDALQMRRVDGVGWTSCGTELVAYGEV